jgi:hypothetical protein
LTTRFFIPEKHYLNMAKVTEKVSNKFLITTKNYFTGKLFRGCSVLMFLILCQLAISAASQTKSDPISLELRQPVKKTLLSGQEQYFEIAATGKDFFVVTLDVVTYNKISNNIINLQNNFTTPSGREILDYERYVKANKTLHFQVISDERGKYLYGIKNIYDKPFFYTVELKIFIAVFTMVRLDSRSV